MIVEQQITFDGFATVEVEFVEGATPGLFEERSYVSLRDNRKKPPTPFDGTTKSPEDES